MTRSENRFQSPDVPGCKEFNLNRPVTADGKKSVYLRMMESIEKHGPMSKNEILVRLGYNTQGMVMNGGHSTTFRVLKHAGLVTFCRSAKKYFLGPQYENFVMARV